MSANEGFGGLESVTRLVIRKMRALVDASCTAWSQPGIKFPAMTSEKIYEKKNQLTFRTVLRVRVGRQKQCNREVLLL